MTVSDILKHIDEAIKALAKKKALEWLEELQSEIEVKADALREDIAREVRNKPKE